MKVLRVAQTVYPDVAGGGAYHVHAMSRDQAAMGHDVTVLTIRQSQEQPHLEERDGYAVVRYDAQCAPLGNALSIGLARHLAAADGYDVVHAHSHLYASTNLAALRRRLDDVPLAITNHGLYSQTAPTRVFDAYLRTVGRWTFDAADVVFCYTDVDERRLRDLGVTTDVAVVHNGVDTQRFSPEGPESDLLDADGPAILFVGRLVDGKRPQDAIAATERVREALPDATLYCCGDGPLREDLERAAGGPDADAVAFLGHVAYDEMPAVYRAADVLVLPSRAEGMPRTVLEALASGTPVVTTDLDHLTSIATERVRTVPVEAPDELASAVLSTLTGATPGAASEARTERAPESRTERASESRTERASESRTEPAVGTTTESPSRAESRVSAGRGSRDWTATDGSAGEPGEGRRAGVRSALDRPSTGRASPPTTAGAPDRASVPLDWQSTVRETTAVLRRLADARSGRGANR